MNAKWKEKEEKKTAIKINQKTTIPAPGQITVEKGCGEYIAGPGSFPQPQVLPCDMACLPIPQANLLWNLLFRPNSCQRISSPLSNFLHYVAWFVSVYQTLCI